MPTSIWCRRLGRGTPCTQGSQRLMHSQKWWVTFVPSLFCCYISDLFSSYFVVESTPHFKIRWQQDFLNPKLGCHICSVKVFPFQRWGMPRIEGHHAGYGRHAWDGWRGRRCVIRLIINDLPFSRMHMFKVFENLWRKARRRDECASLPSTRSLSTVTGDSRRRSNSETTAGSLWLIGSCDSLHFCRNCVATSRRTTCASWVHWMILILNNPKSSWPTTWWPASQSLVCCQLSHDFDNSKARPNCLEASGLPLNCIGLLFFSDPFEFGNHLMIWLLIYAWNILNFLKCCTGQVWQYLFGLSLWITFVAGMQFAVGTNVSWANHASPVSAQRNLETQISPKTFAQFSFNLPQSPLTQFFWNRLILFGLLFFAGLVIWGRGWKLFPFRRRFLVQAQPPRGLYHQRTKSCQ